ncbi:MAG TPA: caspase family protein [Chloroflexia bacterium]|jgi:hypothetical protein
MGKLHAIIVGCNYKGSPHPSLNTLRGAERDARGMYKWVKSSPPPNGELGEVLLLVGKNATSASVREVLNKALDEHFKNVSSEEAGGNDADTLLFYFSGHGRRDTTGLTLFTWDDTLHASELLGILRSNHGRSAVVLDCCHAGAISQSGQLSDSTP